MSFAADYRGARVRPSPNCGPRANGVRPDILLLHYTGMSSGEEAEGRLCHPESNVSSHYIVHEDGRVVQMVPEAMRAWHAGASCWEGERDVNSRSIGIEIVNGGHPAGLPPYPSAQIDVVIGLCLDVIERHQILAHHVLGHSDVAPGRKIDPGEHFPWRILAERGVGLYDDGGEAGGPTLLGPGERGQPIKAVQGLLSLYGYDVAVTGEYDERTRTLIASFQMHYRQSCINGLADKQTIDRLYRLARKAKSAS
ncbi:N-acetylmuramoyl-L-alanine amidase [Notoacmeibacter sp. MSK16QG-6]|uniref:N-acetylmuramoyl-L-alanine amidase n=1 Tax=Notoacmeibacter sp. MSK16QG-6 TaxID=2957982 RepID=UPI00209DC59A|nr:N-acetylmuramoyl-L-alanine amidase [Notoacmeibacter sp. MSK16QG-6]MCP1199713.1 N-acetylmuramoyl-L-alanine amidase [Notoacmeibacter sp. MSK16QG-6]